jgi:hypothetical protein
LLKQKGHAQITNVDGIGPDHCRGNLVQSQSVISILVKQIKIIKSYPGVYHAGPFSEPDDSENFLKDILNDLKDLYPKIVLFKL